MPHAGEVEPLDGARVIIAVGGLVGVDGELHGRGVALLLGLALLLLGRLGPFLPRLQGQLIRRVVHHRTGEKCMRNLVSTILCMYKIATAKLWEHWKSPNSNLTNDSLNGCGHGL
uniref:Uncharacterized protein n=1 Tax=Salmo trutta TaxID=8032 RepID=A0A674F1F1_SALTR